MLRFKVYIFVFLVNLLLFLLSVLFQFQDLAGIINFLSFVISVILFLFTHEEPPKVSKLKIPEVHNYYRSGQNSYSNLVAIEFGLISFLFVTLSYSTGLGVAGSILLLWAFSIPLTYLIIKWNSKKENLEKILDYIRFVRPEFDPAQVRKIVEIFFERDSLDKQSLTKNLNYDSAFLSSLADIYIIYQTQRNQSLLKGEIESINDL